MDRRKNYNSKVLDAWARKKMETKTNVETSQIKEFQPKVEMVDIKKGWIARGQKPQSTFSIHWAISKGFTLVNLLIKP